MFEKKKLELALQSLSEKEGRLLEVAQAAAKAVLDFDGAINFVFKSTREEIDQNLTSSVDSEEEAYYRGQEDLIDRLSKELSRAYALRRYKDMMETLISELNLKEKKPSIKEWMKYHGYNEIVEVEEDFDEVRLVMPPLPRAIRNLQVRRRAHD